MEYHFFACISNYINAIIFTSLTVPHGVIMEHHDREGGEGSTFFLNSR